MTSTRNEKKYFTPPIDTDVVLPSLGNERISAGRFSSSEFMAREWTHLWRKVWNLGPRVEELQQAGDF
ncbi:MAG: hypothetical protein P8M21_12435, partial [Halioglobus sp.]|nr:hypothetical protein [Halioglobus sp.]